MLLRFFVLDPALTIAHPVFTQDLKPAEQTEKSYAVSERLAGLKNLRLWGMNRC